MTEPGLEQHSRDHVAERGLRPVGAPSRSFVVDPCLRTAATGHPAAPGGHGSATVREGAL
ncbi:hypothetical protein [Streptacidiphilus sp. MAP5-3]|uniref:hypothetical protein n=1 Tax=unclassified Streptacidiphilus TaxID=2643834 RepID=UPI0035171935